MNYLNKRLTSVPAAAEKPNALLQNHLNPKVHWSRLYLSTLMQKTLVICEKISAIRKILPLIKAIGNRLLDLASESDYYSVYDLIDGSLIDVPKKQNQTPIIGINCPH